MWERIIEFDRQALVFLNSLGSSTWDPFWLYITHQINWWPFFLFLFYLLYKKLTIKQLVLLIVVLALFFTFTDQMTNLVKNTVQRLRPVNDPELKNIIRVVKGSPSWSYFSGHASNSLGAMIILFQVLRRYYKYTYLVFLFPLIFAYTRIYLGLHFPGDILSGYVFGALSGYLFYKLYLYLHHKLNLHPKRNEEIAN